MQIKVMQVGQLGTNCYLLGDEEAHTAAVVDPGGEGTHILTWLKADGMRLKFILLTRAHFDHTSGVAGLCAALPRVPVYLHPADAALVGGNVFSAVGAETTPYQDGDVVKLGKMDIEVLHTPGRTPGGVTLKMRDVLLTGDILFQGSVGRTDFEGGSYTEVMAPLGRLSRLSGDHHTLPGHIGVSTLKQERKINHYLRKAMEGQSGRSPPFGGKTQPIKLHLHGHDYKYTAEQTLLVPHGSGAPAGAPSDFYVSSGGSESRPAPCYWARECQQHGEGRRS